MKLLHLDPRNNIATVEPLRWPDEHPHDRGYGGRTGAGPLSTVRDTPAVPERAGDLVRDILPAPIGCRHFPFRWPDVPTAPGDWRPARCPTTNRVSENKREPPLCRLATRIACGAGWARGNPAQCVRGPSRRTSWNSRFNSSGLRARCPGWISSICISGASRRGSWSDQPRSVIRSSPPPAPRAAAHDHGAASRVSSRLLLQEGRQHHAPDIREQLAALHLG